MGSPFYGKYAYPYDRYSAFEMLEENARRQAAQKEMEALEAQRLKEQQSKEKSAGSAKTQSTAKKKSGSSALDKALSSSLSQIGRSVSRELVRGMFDTLKK